MPEALPRGDSTVSMSVLYRPPGWAREDALERLLDLVRRAFERPKPRKATRPTKGSKERRLKAKKQRGAMKKLRSGPID